MAPAGRNNPIYEEGEKVLAFHGPVLYEAKVEQFQRSNPSDKNSDWEYLLHYLGWKKSWDEWVTDSRVRKSTEENRTLMKQMKMSQTALAKEAATQKKQKATKDVKDKRKSKVGDDLASSVRASEERHSSVPAPAPSRGTKRARDYELEKARLSHILHRVYLHPNDTGLTYPQEEIYTSRPAIRLPLPDLLKSMLVDDWEWITKDLRLVPIPHAHPVATLLSDYQAAEAPRRRPGSAEADLLDEVVAGVREYFDKSLGRILLYRFERQQWHDTLTKINRDAADPAAVASVTIPATEGGAAESTTTLNLSGKAASEVYGAEHLCRLFVSMPELIAQTNMDGQSVGKLREELGRLTRWLAGNWRAYEARAYVDPGDGYREKARGMN